MIIRRCNALHLLTFLVAPIPIRGFTSLGIFSNLRLVEFLKYSGFQRNNRVHFEQGGIPRSSMKRSRFFASKSIESSKQGEVIFEYPSLLEGTLLRRYKRFFVDVLLPDGKEVVCHCPNTGPMTGLLDGQPKVMVSPSNDPKRKTGFTLEMIQSNGVWVGVHSALANRMVEGALERGALTKFLGEINHVIREFTVPEEKHGGISEVIGPTSNTKKGLERDSLPGTSRKSNKTANSRIDFLLCQDIQPQLDSSDIEKKKGRKRMKVIDQHKLVGRKTYLEVKSVTLHVETSLSQPRAEFPDTVSVRAQKHVKLLTSIAQEGKDDAVMLYLVQRGDCRSFSPCFAKDPGYAELVLGARAAGVRLLPLACELRVEPGGIGEVASGAVVLLGELPLDLPGAIRTAAAAVRQEESRTAAAQVLLSPSWHSSKGAEGGAEQTMLRRSSSGLGRRRGHAVGPEEEGGGRPVESMTVPELRAALRAQGLPVGGRKAELVNRLFGHGTGRLEAEETI